MKIMLTKQNICAIIFMLEGEALVLLLVPVVVRYPLALPGQTKGERRQPKNTANKLFYRLLIKNGTGIVAGTVFYWSNSM